MRLRHGVWEEVEAQADKIIFEHLATITRPADKADVLTPWKEDVRCRREVYVSSTPTTGEGAAPSTGDTYGGGVPDRAIFTGMFDRATNELRPWLNAQPGGWHSNGSHIRRAAGVGRYGTALHTPTALPWLRREGTLTPEHLIFPCTTHREKD